MIPFVSPSWWRARRQQRALAKLAMEALEVTTEAWLFFSETIPFQAGTALEDRVAAFIPPVMQRYKEDFPILVVHTDLAWETIFTAICASGTESTDDIERLRATLLQLRNL